MLLALFLVVELALAPQVGWIEVKAAVPVSVVVVATKQSIEGPARLQEALDSAEPVAVVQRPKPATAKDPPYRTSLSFVSYRTSERRSRLHLHLSAITLPFRNRPANNNMRTVEARSLRRNTEKLLLYLGRLYLYGPPLHVQCFLYRRCCHVKSNRPIVIIPPVPGSGTDKKLPWFSVCGEGELLL